MNICFFDTSAIVKHYLHEVGTSWVTSTVTDAEILVVLAEITLAEVAAVLAARSRAPQGISVARRRRLLNRFLADCQQRYFILKTDRVVIDKAVTLTQSHRLRGYDAVQLATALENFASLTDQDSSPFTFVAADNDLLVAAQAEGLATDNPLAHF